MKRLIAFAVTILTAAFMTACSVTGKNEGTKPNGLGSTFQAAVSVTIGDLDASGTIKRFGDGMWEIEFDSPNTLSGVKLAFGEDGVEASYKGLSFSVPQTALPVKAMMLNLISAVDSLAKNEELSGTEKDGMLEIEGKLEGGEYVLTVDKDGKMVSFAMPNNDLMITFTEVTEITGTQTDTQSSTENTSEVQTTEAVTTQTAA
ncbi:MAG: hypothetical protein E7497_03920 [Ruminococcus sp.]|nr:hypothetical protein [Ruminococcus sp.]